MLEKRRNKNNLLITGLLITIFAMVAGYAALSANLSVNGTSTIANTTSFDIMFTGVDTWETGKAESNYTSFDDYRISDTFRFGVTLKQPGDKIVYHVTIKNLGTIDAEVGSFTNPEAWRASDILTYSVTGIYVGDEISTHSTIIFTITIEWPWGKDIPEVKSADLEFKIHFVQSGTGRGEYKYRSITPVVLPLYTHIDVNNNGLVDQGDQMLLGTYPQTKVTDNQLISTLDYAGYSASSYEYYVDPEPYEYSDQLTCDKNNLCNYMDHDSFFEVIVDGQKYQGTSSGWYKYEDILWDVGKNENGEVTLISNKILYTMKFDTDRHLDSIDGSIIYPNNYKHSAIREWLNNIFYNTAFRTNARNLILSREVIHPVTAEESTVFIPDTTTDKVFLLSIKDVQENSTTYNITLEKSGSDFAKRNGLKVYYEIGSYWLRSPDLYNENSARFVQWRANDIGCIEVDSNSIGVVPVIKIVL